MRSQPRFNIRIVVTTRLPNIAQSTKCAPSLPLCSMFAHTLTQSGTALWRPNTHASIARIEIEFPPNQPTIGKRIFARAGANATECVRGRRRACVRACVCVLSARSPEPVLPSKCVRVAVVVSSLMVRHCIIYIFGDACGKIPARHHCGHPTYAVVSVAVVCAYLSSSSTVCIRWWQ